MGYELYIEQTRPERDLTNGRWLPGHKAPNKGMKRTDFMSARNDRKLKRMGAERFRKLKRSESSGVPKRRVIAIDSDWHFSAFSSIGEAGRMLGLSRHNIGRCARENEKKRIKTRPWGNGITKNEGGSINTDHKYKGIRFYFDDDEIWTTKIKQQ